MEKQGVCVNAAALSEFSTRYNNELHDLTERIYALAGDENEYVYPIKVGLLDVGVYDYQLIPLFECIYQGEKRVISYQTKEVMHRLNAMGITFLAEFDDVSILKCLADGLGNTDGLDFCLQYYGLN